MDRHFCFSSAVSVDIPSFSFRHGEGYEEETLSSSIVFALPQLETAAPQSCEHCVSDCPCGTMLVYAQRPASPWNTNSIHSISSILQTPKRTCSSDEAQFTSCCCINLYQDSALPLYLQCQDPIPMHPPAESHPQNLHSYLRLKPPPKIPSLTDTVAQSFDICGLSHDHKMEVVDQHALSLQTEANGMMNATRSMRALSTADTPCESSAIARSRILHSVGGESEERFVASSKHFLDLIDNTEKLHWDRAACRQTPAEEAKEPTQHLQDPNSWNSWLEDNYPAHSNSAYNKNDAFGTSKAQYQQKERASDYVHFKQKGNSRCWNFNQCKNKKRREGFWQRDRKKAKGWRGPSTSNPVMIVEKPGSFKDGDGWQIDSVAYNDAENCRVQVNHAIKCTDWRPFQSRNQTWENNASLENKGEWKDSHLEPSMRFQGAAIETPKGKEKVEDWLLPTENCNETTEQNACIVSKDTTMQEVAPSPVSGINIQQNCHLEGGSPWEMHLRNTVKHNNQDSFAVKDTEKDTALISKTDFPMISFSTSSSDDADLYESDDVRYPVTGEENTDSNTKGQENQAYEFFMQIFQENQALQRRYKEEHATGEFDCLVCSNIPNKPIKRYNGLVSVVMHAKTILKTKRRHDHRGFARAVCDFMSWDAYGNPLQKSLDNILPRACLVETGNSPQGVAKINGNLAAAHGCSNSISSEMAELTVPERGSISDSQGDKTFTDLEEIPGCSRNSASLDTTKSSIVRANGASMVEICHTLHDGMGEKKTVQEGNAGDGLVINDETMNLMVHTCQPEHSTHSKGISLSQKDAVVPGKSCATYDFNTDNNSLEDNKLVDGFMSMTSECQDVEPNHNVLRPIMDVTDPEEKSTAIEEEIAMLAAMDDEPNDFRETNINIGQQDNASCLLCSGVEGIHSIGVAIHTHMKNVQPRLNEERMVDAGLSLNQCPDEDKIPKEICPLKVTAAVVLQENQSEDVVLEQLNCRNEDSLSLATTTCNERELSLSLGGIHGSVCKELICGVNPRSEVITTSYIADQVSGISNKEVCGHDGVDDCFERTGHDKCSMQDLSLHLEKSIAILNDHHIGNDIAPILELDKSPLHNPCSHHTQDLVMVLREQVLDMRFGLGRKFSKDSKCTAQIKSTSPVYSAASEQRFGCQTCPTLS